jgi:hypothetical protein
LTCRTRRVDIGGVRLRLDIFDRLSRAHVTGSSIREKLAIIVIGG